MCQTLFTEIGREASRFETQHTNIRFRPCTCTLHSTLKCNLLLSLLFSQFVLSLEYEVSDMNSSNSFSIFNGAGYQMLNLVHISSLHRRRCSCSTVDTQIQRASIWFTHFRQIYTMNSDFELATAKRWYEPNRYHSCCRSSPCCLVNRTLLDKRARN